MRPFRLSALFGDAEWSETPDQLLEGGFLADILPYRSYDADTGFYGNAESTGFIFETLPVPASDEIPNAFHSALTAHCPSNTTVQVINWTSPDIDDRLERWVRPRMGQSEIMRRSAQARLAHLKSLRFGDNAIARTIPHHRRVFIAAFMDGEADGDAQRRLRDLRDALVSAVGGSSSVRDLDPTAFLTLLSDVLMIRSFDRSSRPDYDDQMALNRQLSGAALSVEKRGLSFNCDPQVSASVATVKKYPAEYRFDLTQMLSGQPEKLVRPHGPVLTTMSMRVLSPAQTSSLLLKKHGSLEHVRGSVIGRFIPYLEERLEEVKSVSLETEGGEKLFQSITTVVAYRGGSVEQSHSGLSDLANIYRTNAFELQNDSNMQLPVFLSALPFALSKQIARDFDVTGRMKLVKGRALAELIPLYGEWLGNASGTGVLLTGRQGQISTWRNFDAATNFNVTVTGASGSGKSVFMQELVASSLADGGQVIVIDDGYSFARLCKAFGGQFVAFDGREEIRLNPFALIDPGVMSDPEHPKHAEYRSDALELITKTVATMASLSDQQTGRVQDVEEDLIRNVVAEVWDCYGASSEITHVRDLLLEKSKTEHRLGDIVTKLGRFSKGGDFGSYFTGPSKLSLNAPLAVFELSDIKQQRGLESVLMQLIMFIASEAMFKSPRDQAVTIVVDEAWDLLHADMTGKFLESIIRRARKYRGGLVTGTQSLSDYDRSHASRVCREMSATQVLLKQNAETIDAAADTGAMKLSPASIYHLKSLHSVPGHFSELAIRGEDGGFIFGRLLLDPYSLALYSSKAETVARVEAAQEAGRGLADALADVAYSGEAQ